MTQDTATMTAARPSRRSVTRAAGWTVPVIAVAATAPAYAASLCADRSSMVLTTTAGSTAPAQGFTRTSNTSASWRTNDPDGAGTTYTNARIAITATKTGSVEYGFNTSTNNLITYTTGGVTGVSINQRPSTTTSTRGYAARTITKFDFQRLVYDLNFTIADISKSGDATTTSFWDAVWIETDGVFSIIDRGQYVIGGGTSSTDPLTQSNNAPNLGDADATNVTLQFSGRATFVTLHYWSSIKTSTDSRGGQGITVSNMSMMLAPDGCV